jgi:hypothetical protein
MECPCEERNHVLSATAVVIFRASAHSSVFNLLAPKNTVVGCRRFCTALPGHRKHRTLAMLTFFFYFSPHMQLAFTWQTGLPEMIGSTCLTTVFVCRMVISRNIAAILLYAAGAGICAVNFALGVYVPHLVPLAWTAVIFVACWTILRWRQVLEPPLVWWRLMGLGIGLTIILIGIGIFYVEAREASIPKTQAASDPERA